MVEDAGHRLSRADRVATKREYPCLVWSDEEHVLWQVVVGGPREHAVGFDEQLVPGALVSESPHVLASCPHLTHWRGDSGVVVDSVEEELGCGTRAIPDQRAIGEG